MSREIVRLHTIAQWKAIDPAVRSVILQSIKLKDRLSRFIEGLANRPKLTDAIWVPCRKCEQKGWVQKHPRHAGLHPSQWSKPCLLQLYWQMEGRDEFEKISPREFLIFEVGHAIHHMLQGYGQNGAWGPHYKPEVRMTEGTSPVATELMVEGSADAENILVIDDIPNAPIYELRIIHEYKTIKTENFKKLTRPKPEHMQQGTIYCATLDAPVTVFLYFSKDDSNLADFPVQFDDALWSTLREKALVLVDHYDRHTPPQANVGYHCRQCGFANVCEAYKAAQPANQRVVLRR